MREVESIVGFNYAFCRLLANKLVNTKGMSRNEAEILIKHLMGQIKTSFSFSTTNIHFWDEQTPFLLGEVNNFLSIFEEGSEEKK